MLTTTLLLLLRIPQVVDDRFPGLHFGPQRRDPLLQLCDRAVAGLDGEAGYFASGWKMGVLLA